MRSRHILFPGLIMFYIAISFCGADASYTSKGAIDGGSFPYRASKTVKDSDVHLADFTRDALANTDIYPWFTKVYNLYRPAPKAIDSLKLIKDNLNVTVFGGSWCSDTKKLLPAFYKTVEEAGISSTKITLIGVDRKKKSIDHSNRRFHIKKVPTFILYYDGNEIGRIVEVVHQSIEEDMLNLYRAKKSFQ